MNWPRADWQTDDGRVRLYRGDCLGLLPRFPAGAVDAVATDPPYGMRNNRDSKRFSGGNRALHRGEGRDDWPEVIDDDKPFDPAPWLAFPRVVLWGCNHFAARLPVGTTLVWIKKADHLFGSFLSDCELGWMKGGHGVYAFRKQFPPPVRIQEGGGRVLHPNQKPVGLMRWCLERCQPPTCGLVMDPYMGSGTTAIACLQTGYDFVGVEENPAYFDTAVRRIERALAEPDLYRAAPSPAETPELFTEVA